MLSSPIPFPRRKALGKLAALCLGVLVFSYLLTFAIALSCLALPLLFFANGSISAVGFLLGSMGLIIGCTILWSLVPRRDPFQVSGAEIDLNRQPRLRALIEEIATRIEQPMPDKVYLIPDANAFVTERGGTLGCGGTRIMGLGMPLIAGMSTAEFGAVLSHEFAHYYSGDTRLGPRVFQTRMAMARTLQNLGSRNPGVRLLSRLAIAALLYALVIGALVAYWKLFMRFTQLVSRQLEYRSDELACCIAGPSAMAGGLRSVAMIGAATPSFWKAVIDPVVTLGYCPPLADGFARFYSSPGAREGATRALGETLKNSKTNAYDTHPPLKSRLERIGKMQAVNEDGADRSPALALLDGLPELERRMLAAIAPKVNVAGLKPMNWDSAAQLVWLPVWKASTAQHADLLAGKTIGSLPALAGNLSGAGAQISDPPGRLLTREQRSERAFSLLWMAFALRLEERGWQVHMQPGEFFLAKGEERISPSDALLALRQGRTSAADWQNWCAKTGLADVELAPVAARTAAG